MSYYATVTPSTPTPYSPEDTAVKGTAVNGGRVDKWGETNLGAGFGITNTTSMAQPYYIPGTTNGIAGPTTATWNMVSGPRHVLRLVDGGMDAAGNSYLPQPILPATFGNGFTVVSEEPVYIWGNYNSGVADPFFPSFWKRKHTHDPALGGIHHRGCGYAPVEPAGDQHESVEQHWLDRLRELRVPRLRS